MVIISVFAAVVFARTYQKRYGRFFAATMVGILLWALGDLLVLFAQDEDLLRAGALLFYICPMVIPIFIWFFAISFPENRQVGKWPWLVAGSVFGIYTLLFIFKFDFFVADIHTYGELNAPIPQLPGFVLYAAYFSLFFMLTYYAFYQKVTRYKGLAKTQVGYTFYGALIASVPALVTNLSLPIMGQKGIIWLGPFFTLFFAGAVTVAIVRHRLFDIRPVIVRSLGYATTIIIIATLYGFVIFSLAQILFDLRLSLPVQITLALSTGLAALLFQNLKLMVDKYTRQIFYRDAYDPQALFDEYNKTLVSTIDLDVLLKRTSRVVSKYMKSEFCFIGVKDGGPNEYRIVGTDKRIFDVEDIERLRAITPHLHRAVIVVDDLSSEYQDLQRLLASNNIDVLVRLTTDFHHSQEGLGYIVLGQKKSGNQYTKQDAQIIETLANELIIALQNALRFEEIERFNEVLQQRVDDATRQLRATNKKLKELNNSKDDFISMTSHQLRTPLTSIKGYISLVADGDAGKVNAAQRKLLAQAYSGSEKLVYLVADLLNVSRIKTGKFTLERQPTNLVELVKAEVEQLKEEAASRGLELVCEVPDSFPTLQLDETKLRQVVMNYIDNAIYYTPRGGRVVAQLKEFPHSIEFRVIDNGIGVPKAERHQLFQKFYRAKNAQRTRPDGTGLGLYMAQKVIASHGGAIIFDTEEGKGSQFGFMFPKSMPQGMVDGPVRMMR